MYRLLIVDDEKNIRLGIQAMIIREFSDVIETIVATDGLDALDKMNEQKIDILITDIRMPGMDGIQLMHQLQMNESKPATVVLSGFDDFEYTKEAIKCQVKDYLLKPVNRSELYQTIRKIIEELTENLESSHQQLDEIRSNELTYIFLNPYISDDEIEKRCRKMHLEKFSKGFFVGVVKYNRMFDENIILRRLNQLLEAKYEKKENDFFILCSVDDRIIIIAAQDEIFSYMSEKLANEKLLTLSLGVSEKQKEIREIKNAYMQAEEALKYHLLFPKQTVFLHKAMTENKGNFIIPITEIKKISNMLGTEREKEIKTMLLYVLNYEKIAKHPIRYLEDISNEMNRIIFDNFFTKLGDEYIEAYNRYNQIKNIFIFECFHDYYQAVEDLIFKIHECLKKMKTVYSEQKYMEKALSFIKENFHKDLNLAVVSNHISLNYSYFSHMFKEYTGHNFVDYLKQVRIEQAKELLSQTDLKVFEISDKIGYKNPKQFARVFREIEGISPKEYREQI